MMRASAHAEDRGRERLSLKPASVQRMAEIAWEKGLTPADFSGKLRRYLDAKALNHPGSQLRIYGEVVFAYRPAQVLATCWGLPQEFKRVVAKVRSARKEPAP